MPPNPIFEVIKIVLTIAGGLYIFFKGLRAYKMSAKLKRAEFLDKLITDFLNPETEIARNMLDDFVYVKKGDLGLSPREQKEVANSLSSYLRDHKKNPIELPEELIVRNSFDRLLDFITKLSYYLDQRLITSSELGYFKYYIDKIENNEAVTDYIKIYFYPKDFEILFNALVKPKPKPFAIGMWFCWRGRYYGLP